MICRLQRCIVRPATQWVAAALTPMLTWTRFRHCHARPSRNVPIPNAKRRFVSAVILACYRLCRCRCVRAMTVPVVPIRTPPLGNVANANIRAVPLAGTRNGSTAPTALCKDAIAPVAVNMPCFADRMPCRFPTPWTARWMRTARTVKTMTACLMMWMVRWTRDRTRCQHRLLSL